eukprot:542188_1
MADTEWSTYASVIYFSLYFILVVSLSVYIHRTEEYERKKDFLKSIWARRGIYGQILAHLYDTATDIGVMIEWGILAYDSNDYKSIDMRVMFWATVGFQLFYRVVSAMFAGLEDEYLDDFNVVNGCLGFWDMYIIRTIYLSLKQGHEEATPQQRANQLLEALFESLPQVVLQSVFIIRSWNDQQLRDNSSIELIAASLAASLFSISNKYTWLDDVALKDSKPDWKAKCPCVNKWYVLRVIWRFSFVGARFCALSLVWSVWGGAFVGIFLLGSFLIWFAAFFPKSPSSDTSTKIKQSAAWAMACLISTPATADATFVCIHIVEMIVLMSITTIFAYIEFDCLICADATQRQATNNPYIKLFIFAGWINNIGTVIDFIAYGVLLFYDKFENDSAGGVGDLFMSGMESTVEKSDKKSEEEKKGKVTNLEV